MLKQRFLFELNSPNTTLNILNSGFINPALFVSRYLVWLIIHPPKLNGFNLLVFYETLTLMFAFCLFSRITFVILSMWLDPTTLLQLIIVQLGAISSVQLPVGLTSSCIIRNFTSSLTWIHLAQQLFESSVASGSSVVYSHLCKVGRMYKHFRK